MDVEASSFCSMAVLEPIPNQHIDAVMHDDRVSSYMAGPCGYAKIHPAQAGSAMLYLISTFKNRSNRSTVLLDRQGKNVHFEDPQRISRRTTPISSSKSHRQRPLHQRRGLSLGCRPPLSGNVARLACICWRCHCSIAHMWQNRRSVCLSVRSKG